MVMNRERMLKVADEIEFYDDHFDMGVWMTNDWMAERSYEPTSVVDAVKHMDLDECGSAACVAGWAAFLYAGELQSSDTFWSAGERILGLTHEQADELFQSDGEAADIAGKMRRWVQYDELYPDAVLTWREREELWY